MRHWTNVMMGIIRYYVRTETVDICNDVSIFIL
jgi:hypothetical protein